MGQARYDENAVGWGPPIIAAPAGICMRARWWRMSWITLSG